MHACTIFVSVRLHIRSIAVKVEVAAHLTKLLHKN